MFPRIRDQLAGKVTFQSPREPGISQVAPVHYGRTRIFAKAVQHLLDIVLLQFDIVVQEQNTLRFTFDQP
jgi:hypothetical protein